MAVQEGKPREQKLNGCTVCTHCTARIPPYLWCGPSRERRGGEGVVVGLGPRSGRWLGVVGGEAAPGGWPATLLE